MAVLQTVRKHFPVLVLTSLLVLNALALAPELTIGRVNSNDSVFHFTMVERMVDAINRGENPLDCWVGEWVLGYPVSRTYQPLGHLLVALLYFAFGKTISLMSVFVFVRYLAIVLFPLTVYVAARLLLMSEFSAVAAALITPLIASKNLFGLDYISYVWRGDGLFTQALAMHLLLISLGLGFRGMRRLPTAIIAGLMLGITFLTHFIYGFIGALCFCIMAVLPNTVAIEKRVARLVTMGATSLLISSFALIPTFLDSALINHSRWEPGWKWASYGAVDVLKMVFSGEIVDFGRIPTLSVLVLAGFCVCFLRWRKKTESQGPALFLMCGSVLWLLLFFGTSTWGILFDVLGARDLQLHRLSGAVQVFFILLAGTALGTIWEWCLANSRFGALFATVITIGLLFPAVLERRDFLKENNEWGKASLAAVEQERPMVDAVAAKVKQMGGRVYLGKSDDFKVGDIPIHALLSTQQLPEVSFAYHSMSLPSDVMFRFDQNNPSHYQLFNVASVVSDGAPLPSFLIPREKIGRFQVSQTPANGYFGVVRVPFSVVADKISFYDVCNSWLETDWASKRTHILLDFFRDAPKEMVHLIQGQTLPPMSESPSPGVIESEQKSDEIYTARVIANDAAYVLFRMTFHPNWRATVDGVSQKTVMLTPGFVGVPVSAGPHQVQLRYQPDKLKVALIFVSISCFGLFLALASTAVADRVESNVTDGLVRVWTATRPQLRSAIFTVFGLLLLAVPVFLPLTGRDLPSGHDALAYHPRLIEFHENVSKSVLLPRWAPDLEYGAGEPLFIFSPPLPYYVAELFHLAGFDVVRAMNLHAVLMVIASAGSMFLLANFLFGRTAAWIAAAAYIFAPYFHVDLYVRHAWSELTVFPFYPLALYGFARYAETTDARFIGLGALAYGGVVVSHAPSALIFFPVLLAFIAYLGWKNRSRSLAAKLAAGILLALGVSAFVWLPALAEVKFVNIERSIQGTLDYRSHFVHLQQFISANWGFGPSVAGSEDTMSFSLGWSHLLLVIPAFVLARRNESRRGWTLFFGSILAALVVAMIPWSEWLWAYLPLLKQVQFPWRLLGPATVCVSLLAAIAARNLSSVYSTRLILGLGLALIILPNLTHIGPEGFIQIDKAHWTPLLLAQSGFETTTNYEFEPRWVSARGGFMAEKVRTMSGNAKVEIVNQSPVVLSLESKASVESEVEAAILFFPGWGASLDGAPTQLTVSQPTGRVRFRVPSGTHRVIVKFQRTPVRLISECTSLLALVAILAMCLRKR